MSEQPTKRKRGGQPGNHNRLKHGRYMSKENLRVLPSTSGEQLSTLDHLIVAIKKTIHHTYAVGLTFTDIDEINKTLRSLSLAAYGLCRLLYLRDRLTSVPYFLRYAGKDEILQTLTKFNWR